MRKEHLADHLPYELLMLRYTMAEIRKPQSTLLWNALFESFGVHARNLYDFLTNGADSRSLMAKDFNDSLKVDKGDVSGKMDRLRSEVLHLGKRRKGTQAEKIDLSDAEAVFGWIEAGMATFIASLGEYIAYWDANRADPSKVAAAPPTQGPTGPAQQSSTSHIVAVSYEIGKGP